MEAVEVEDLLLLLEYPRRLLVQPTEAVYVKELKVTFEGAVSGDCSFVNSCCSELLSEESSVFERSCAEIFLCGLSSAPSSNLVERISEVYYTFS